MKRQTFSSGARWESLVGYSRAVRVGRFVQVAGTTATGPDGALVGAGDAGEQTRQALRNVEAALLRAGAELRHVVRTRIYVTDIDRWEEIGRIHGEVFGEIRPATSMVEVSRLISPGMLVEIEAEAILDGGVGTLARSALLGAASGMRTLTGPAQLSRYLGRANVSAAGGDTGLFVRRDAGALLRIAAVAEMVVDKLPIAPDRIEPGSLLGRAISGALVGGALARMNRGSGLAGTLLGAAGAVASAHLTFRARRGLTRGLGLPDAPVALLEDALAVGTARRALRS